MVPSVPRTLPLLRLARLGMVHHPWLKLCIPHLKKGLTPQYSGYFVFAVYSTAKETEYLLQASSLNEMEDWIVALVLAGASPEKER